MQMNGFDLERYQSTVAALKQQPEAAKVTFRGRFDWEQGFGGTARSVEVEQAGELTPRPFVFRCDVPVEMLGDDSGSMPAERMLSALAHCVGTSFAVQATKHGVDLQALQVELTGEVDLCGFLDLGSARPGFSGIDVRVLVRTNAPEAELARLGRDAARFSPMFDSLSRPVSIDLQVERA
ncbi:MAG TPA: OsmC family protein [Trueperaceae bacterium]